MRKLTLLVDMDGIVADMLASFLALFNHEHGTRFTKADVHSWNLATCLRTSQAEIDSYFDRSAFFLELAPLPGALVSLAELAARGHEIVFVTANWGPESAADKLRWLRLHFPPRLASSYALTTRKDRLRGDVLIDDAPHNIEAHARAWPGTKLVSIEYPYNAHVTGIDLLAPSFADTATAWDRIVHFVDDLAVSDPDGRRIA